MGHEIDRGQEDTAAVAPRKPRFLCLHGFRTSGEILRTQINKWPESVLQRLDLVVPDGPFSSVRGPNRLMPTLLKMLILLPFLVLLSISWAGDKDFLKPYGLELLESCVDSIVIKHPKGHTIPRIDDENLPVMMSFLGRIQKIVSEDKV